MIDQQTILRLQSYVDNELGDREARDVSAQLERDAEARALCATLTELRTMVAANELEVKVPESREFYWSKIQRQLLQDSVVPAKLKPTRQGWWMRILVPVAGCALLLVTTLFLVRPHPARSMLSELHEIETPLQDTSTISFHSQSAGMTVVWVQTDGY